MYSDLSGMIRSAREAAGISQAELAKETGLSSRTVSRLESGGENRNRPRRSVVLRIALALNQDPNPWLQAVVYTQVGEKEIENVKQALAMGERAVRRGVLSTQDLMPILREIANDQQIKSLTMKQLIAVIQLKLKIQALINEDIQKPAID